MIDEQNADSPTEPTPDAVEAAPAVVVAEAEVPATAPIAEPETPELAVTMITPRSIEDRVEPGSILERTVSGWQARLHYGGQTRLFGEGVTIAAAITDAGA